MEDTVCTISSSVSLESFLISLKVSTNFSLIPLISSLVSLIDSWLSVEVEAAASITVVFLGFTRRALLPFAKVMVLGSSMITVLMSILPSVLVVVVGDVVSPFWRLINVWKSPSSEGASSTPSPLLKYSRAVITIDMTIYLTISSVSISA